MTKLCCHFGVISDGDVALHYIEYWKNYVVFLSIQAQQKGVILKRVCCGGT